MAAGCAARNILQAMVETLAKGPCLQAVQQRITLQALVGAFAKGRWLQAARQRNAWRVLVEAFAKGPQAADHRSTLQAWLKHSPRVNGRSLLGCAPSCKLCLKRLANRSLQAARLFRSMSPGCVAA